MIQLSEQSYINIAEGLLKKSKDPIDLYELFDQVIDLKNESIPAEKISDILLAFYADITSSAKFVYTGSNTWDLKSKQRIELWEKDGSFYNEYAEVSDPAMDQRIALQLKKEAQHEAMLESRKAEAEAKALLDKQKAVAAPEGIDQELDQILTQEETLEEITFEETPVEIIEEAPKTDAVEEDELDEDYFDEEKYNEYMDKYEDKYDEE